MHILRALSLTTLGFCFAAPAIAQAPAQRPPASVAVAKAESKTVPVRFDALGTVQAIASVTLRPRIDSVIMQVLFKDGAEVKEGDLLYKLDSRQLDAQVRQAEGQLAKNRAALEGAQRDFARVTELLARDATSRKLVDDAKTAQQSLAAQVQADEANLDNLKVQLSYTQVRSPITGRIGTAPVKVGNLVRMSENTSTLGSILQISPIYVAFGVPQRLFGDMRNAMDGATAKVDVVMTGANGTQAGKIAVLDNTIDATTGLITVRAEFPNAEQALWPGAIASVRVTLRDEDKITVPAQAVQSGQAGTFVFVNENNVAKIKRVVLNRTQDGTAIIDSGLSAGDQVVVEGQLLIVDGSPIAVRNKPAS